MTDKKAKTLAAASKHPTYLRVAEWLRRCFPGVEIEVAEVVRLVQALKTSEPAFIAELERLVQRPFPAVDAPDRQAPTSRTNPAVHPNTYLIDAVHLRSTPIYSCFTGVVKAARVTLHEREKLPFVTHYGWIWAHDHIVFTNEEIRAWLTKNYPDFKPSFARVDLITPARHDLFRFAPVALFFAYETTTSTVPSFFIIESGYATGKPAVLYLGRTMDTKVVAKTGYKPTPWSSPDNIYTSTLTLQDHDDPDVLVIESRQQLDERPYITLTMKYTIEASPGRVIWPALQTLEAAVRIESISLGMGEQLKELEHWMAEFGLQHYAWNLWPVPQRTSP